MLETRTYPASLLFQLHEDMKVVYSSDCKLLAALCQLKWKIAAVSDRRKAPLTVNPVCRPIHLLALASGGKVMPDLTSGGFKYTERGAGEVWHHLSARSE